MRQDRNWRWVWLLALVPAAVGLAFALLLWAELLPNQVLRAWTDVGTLLLTIGVLVTLLAGWQVAAAVMARRRLEQALAREKEQSAEAHRRFVGRLHHELKNPLTAIGIGLQMAREVSSDAQLQETVADGLAQVERLGRLLADLRKLGELETMELEKSPMDMAQLVEEAVDLAKQQPSSAERDVLCNVQRAPWPLPSVQGDGDLLFLAVYNLLDNALKFTSPGDRLEVRALEADAAVVVEVADTGPGVPGDELPHIFEELYRGMEARSVEGRGLGLALVKAVVERHGGTITVRSRPGEGSVFTVRLPVG